MFTLVDESSFPMRLIIAKSYGYRFDVQVVSLAVLGAFQETLPASILSHDTSVIMSGDAKLLLQRERMFHWTCLLVCYSFFSDLFLANALPQRVLEMLYSARQILYWSHPFVLPIAFHRSEAGP